jgi:CubicO group peptidase (beta-lactamase class C family)
MITLIKKTGSPSQGSIILIILLCLVALLADCSRSSSPSSAEPPVDGLQYVTPEQVGWSSQKLDPAELLAQQAGYEAVMAAYDGQVFFSWGEVSRNLYVHSIRKPFLSALYGIHVHRGEINLDETLEELGIDDSPPGLTPDEKQATVRELLQSRSGVYHLAAAEDRSMDSLRPVRGSHPHGTFYYYNNWDFNVAGTIFRQKTGLDIFETFKDEIADPIGMKDFSTSNCFYQFEYDRSQHPAYVFRMSARDMLRLGVLYQRGGSWLGRQIIPSSWITESTSSSYSIMDSTYGVGYGYLWMIAPPGSPAAQLFVYPCYFHTGAGVHVLVIMPEAKLVLVLRLDTDGLWVDPGDPAQMQLIATIVNARL